MKMHKNRLGRALTSFLRFSLTAAGAAMAISLVLLGLRVASVRAAEAPGSVPMLPPTMNVGRVALGFSGPVPGFDLQVPDTKMEVMQETAGKLCPPWYIMLRDNQVRTSDDEIVVLLGMGLTLPAMAVGGTHGAFVGVPSRKVDKASMELVIAMAALQVEEAMRSRLMFLIWDKKPRTIQVFTNTFPRETVFPVRSLLDELAPVAGSYANVHKDDLHELAEQGFGTLALLRVINHGLSGRDGHNSRLCVNMAVKVALVRVSDSTQITSFYAQYEGRKDKFLRWSSEHAQPFREEFERGLQNVAEQISAGIPSGSAGKPELAGLKRD